MCGTQIRDNRHLVVEHPAGSEIFPLDCFENIWNAGNVVKINAPQCALGLVIDGQLIYNNTTLFASRALLLEPFEGWNCTCTAHGSLEGRCGNGGETKFAQVWPREM